MRSIAVVSEELGLPEWWIGAVAIEYADCREFATRNEIWTFNLDRITEEELRDAIGRGPVITERVVQNVRTDVWSRRTMGRLISSVPVPLVENREDILPEGPISDYHFLFRANPLEAWDPKLDFSEYFQVLDEGTIWQWRIARFETIEGKPFGRWVSDEVDLTPMEEVREKLADLRNPVVQPGEGGHKAFRRKVRQFYDWLEAIREPVRAEMFDIHLKRKEKAGVFPKQTHGYPPLLSRFETYTVRENRFFTRFYADPVFFRACHQHVSKAESFAEIGLAENLDEIYQERIGAIITGVACLESFIDREGGLAFPDEWPIQKRLSLRKKWGLYFRLAGKEVDYDLGRPPYQIIAELSGRRNQLVHYKHHYRPTGLRSQPRTELASLLAQPFVAEVPRRLAQAIRSFCERMGLDTPAWLTPQVGWMLET